jgi:capsular exopolysaccharide synthesis family protein
VPGENGTPASKRERSATAIASLLVTQPDVPASYIESLNQLFANLALVYRERPVKIMVFTSPLPGEGKTLSALNFALTGASRGFRVLLVDADLRCGMMNTVLRCRREPGFAELLDGTAQINDVVQRIALGESGAIGFIPTGALPKVPGRVLTIEKVQKVLGALAPKFDFVVIDTPPVNLLADAALLASAADAVLLVVRAGYTRSDALRYAMDQLEAAQAPVVGTVLNDIDLRRHSSDDGAYRYITEAERYYVAAR